MPIYEYICNSCAHEVEEIQKFSDPPLVKCPQCNQNALTRKMSASAFHLKGGGWYKDGYSSSSSNSDKKGTSSKSSSSKKTETKTSSSTTSSTATSNAA